MPTRLGKGDSSRLLIHEKSYGVAEWLALPSTGS